NVTEKSYLKQAEITRYEVVEGEKRASKYFQVDLHAALAGDKEANVELQPYDVLNVRQMTNWREAEQATISGEVRFSGSYPIEEGERLSDLLERVGGFTDKAYLRAAVFTRESIREEQQRQLYDLSKRIEDDIARQSVVVSDVKDATIAGRQKKSLETAKRVQGQLKSIKATGRLVIQLSDLKHFKGSEFDIRLKDGDKLYVQQRPDQVMVLGQVFNQSAFVFQDKLDRDDYVDMSGGTTDFADEGRIYVVRASGEVDPHNGFLSRPIEPGDVIVVPEKLSQFNLVDSVLDWSRVMMQVGVGVASMKVIGIL
ncbi:MAG: SLBB domain-containing protein, partial [Mariprofundaceae bacterium]|nr:SLBB domain-containing protein [Mariprofundaceae bacterium]